MPSWKVRISSSPPRRARNSTTTRSVCSPTAIAGNARSRRTSRSTRRTGDEMTVAALFFYLFASICVASAVMVRDVVFTALRQVFLTYLTVGGLIGILFFVELVLVVGSGALGTGAAKAIAEPIPPLADVTNTEALGLVLYTRYVYYFEVAGLVLLVAMIGAIVLTLRHKPNVKRQNIADQVARTKATAIKIRRVRPGQGI